MSDHTMCPGCHQLRYWTDFDARCSQCRQPTPSSGEEAESSPQCRCSMLSWSPLCERHGWLALIRRIQALEAGPRSPPTTAPVMSTAPSGAEPCSICHLPQESGPPRRPMAPVLEPASPPECTDPAIPSSSPSGQPTTPIYHVVPTCGCAWPYRMVTVLDSDGTMLDIRCQECDASWLHAEIRVPAAPASPSEST
jgi:hypothetical protein